MALRTLVLLVMLLAAGPACAGDAVPLILALPHVDDVSGDVLEQDGRLCFAEAEPVAIDAALASLPEDPALKTALSFLAAARARVGRDPSQPVVIVVTDLWGEIGPVHVVRPGRLEGGAPVDLDAFLVLAPMPPGTGIDLARAHATGMTARMLVHELGHHILHEVLGFDLAARTAFPAGEIRNMPVVTDPVLAFSEGFAEALESTIAGSPAIPPLDVVADQPLRRMQRERNDWLVRDRYVWESLPELDGELLTGFQMVSTEGVVGSLMHELFTNRGLGRGEVRKNFERVVDVLHAKKCQDFRALYRELLAGAGAQRQTMLRILLETTRYTTVDAGAAARAGETYRTSLAAKRALPQDEARDELMREAAEAKQAWKQYKEALFAEVVAGARDPFAMVPDAEGALWVEDRGRRVALNLARPQALGDLFAGLWGDGQNALTLATRIAGAREAGDPPYFADVAAMGALLEDGDRAGRLDAARDEYLTAVKAARGQGGSLSAYLRPDPGLLLRALRQIAP